MKARDDVDSPDDESTFSVILFVLVLLLPLPSSATAIAVTFSRGKVVVAADSLTLVWDGNSTVRETSCKLVQTGDTVFAASGFLLLNDVDVRDLARAAIRASPTVEDAREAFSESVKPLLQNAFRWARKNAPATPRVLAAVFVTKRGEDDAFAVSGVLLFERENLPFPMIETTRMKCGKDCNRETFFMLGSQETAHSLFPQLIGNRALDSIAIAERLVQSEMEANPSEVGGSLQVISLSKRRIDWIKRPAVCESSAR